MTVAVTARRVAYTASGASTGPFAVTFPFYEIDVYVNGSIVNPSQYTVSQATPGGTGDVIFAVAPTGTVAIVGNTRRAQETDYVENDPFSAETHETALDRLAMVTMELHESIAKSFRTGSDKPTIDPIDLGSVPGRPVTTRGDGGAAVYTGADGYLKSMGGAMVSASGIETDETRVYRSVPDAAKADVLVGVWFVPSAGASFWGSEETTSAPSGITDLNLWTSPGFYPDTAIPGVHTNTPPSSGPTDRWSVSVIQHGEPNELLQVAWPGATNLDNGRGLFIRGQRANGTWTVWHGIPII